MKIISICKKCRGTGNITACKFLKKTCPVCKGAGKMTKHLSDIKYKDKERNKFFLHS
jgi:DnaJ-class molecular chaperone